MVAIALDETDLAILERHLDAAAARAHVAGGEFRFLLGVIVERNPGRHESVRCSVCGKADRAHFTTLS
jgi:hypothetical protein